MKLLLKDKLISSENRSIIGVIHNDPINSIMEGILMKANLFEIRLDILQKNINLLESLKYLSNLSIPSIITLRSKSQGGFFKGGKNLYFKLYTKYIPFCSYVDIEYNSNKRYIKNLVEKIKHKNKKIKIILSVHAMFKPFSLSTLYKICKIGIKMNVDIIKIASIVKTKKNILDLLLLYNILKKKQNKICIIPIENNQVKYRYKFIKYGVGMTYCYINQPLNIVQPRIDDMVRINEQNK